MFTTLTFLISHPFVDNGIVLVVVLITVLALKEILISKVEKGFHKPTRIEYFLKGLNVAIIPLLLVFISIVTYKTITTLKII